MAAEEKNSKNDTPEISSEERAHIEEAYRKKGAQTLSYKEYMALKEKKKNRKGLSLPLHVKFILGTPFLILFGYGVFFIPWMLYVVWFSPPEKSSESKKERQVVNEEKDRTSKKDSER